MAYTQWIRQGALCAGAPQNISKMPPSELSQSMATAASDPFFLGTSLLLSACTKSKLADLESEICCTSITLGYPALMPDLAAFAAGADSMLAVRAYCRLR